MTHAQETDGRDDGLAVLPGTDGERRRALELFAFSFVALFLELMVIRWVPSAVRLVAYYTNLMLISSFLGLGVGATLARHRRDLLGWFPLVLLFDLAFLLFARRFGLASSATESRFFSTQLALANILVLVGIFVFNTAVFIPLGQRIGRLFHTLSPLRAYSWDLGGSLMGTVVFGLFSLSWFSPIAGMLGVAAAVVALSPRSQRPWAAPVLIVAVLVTALTEKRDAIWSPYHYITYTSNVPIEGTIADLADTIRTRIDPPIYSVQVNQDFYQFHGTLDLRRYSPDYPSLGKIEEMAEGYGLPYQVARGRDRVLVLGAGGGLDAEAALLAGARHVDAVEIDPVLVDLSRRYSPSGIYQDPKVTVHIDDARAFLRRAEPGYDLVAFGLLDSQTLFSHMSNIRLDGFTYTVESLRSAFGLLAPEGVMSVTFVSYNEWIAPKLQAMVAAATGVDPIFYARGYKVVILAARDPEITRNAVAATGTFQRYRPRTGARYTQDLATDDWPFLYLREKTIPRDYLIVIATLFVLSLGFLVALRGRSFDLSDAHFLFMGLGFLLLQTKTIGDCSLYFGASWFVTMLVVAGVLLMVLAANLAAIRQNRFSKKYYVCLFASLVLLSLVPREAVLGLPLAGRLAWTLLAAPLPIFFAGLIFSSTFRDVKVPSARFGANLIGAVAGGFLEYASMAIGFASLSWIVVLAYVLSFGCLSLASRR